MSETKPVAAQCKFDHEPIWNSCSLEHHFLVQSNPSEWRGYKTRALYAEPQPAPAPLSEQDPLQGAANWLVKAHPGLETSTLAGKLSIGYNRAKRLHDAALAAKEDK